MTEVIDFRIESEYFLKKFLKIDDVLSKIKTIKFIKAAKAVNGRAYDSEAFNCKDGIFISKIGDVTNKRQIKTWEKVTDQEFVRQKGRLLKDNDILMALTGDPPDVGKVNLINCKDIRCTWNQRVAKIVLNKNIYLSHNILYVVLSCELIRMQMERFAKGIRQRNLGNDCFKHALVPLFSMKFQRLLEFSVTQYKNMLILSDEKYSQAQNILISELGLENFNPSSEKVSIKTLKESFLKTGRLDSEYYQSKYEIFDEKISNIGVEKLENICSLINYGTVPTSPYVKNNKSIPYIKGMNLKNCFVVGELDEIESTEELQDKFFTKENDIIISQMGTVGDIGLVTKEQENYLFASFTIRARLNDERFNPYFVGAYIQNVAKDFYLYRNIAQASVRQNTDLPTIKNMSIPLVKKEAQDEIASYIKQSMEYSKKAKELLEISIKSVEIAIDKDEETAQNFLDRQTDPNCLL